MSDQKLRELERRWKESGSPDDEAAYLLERVRVGDLTRERLELAAYCGHEGARRATADGPLANAITRLVGLERWGVPVLVAALSHVVNSEMTQRESSGVPVDQGSLLTARDASEWSLCPCEAHALRLVACDADLAIALHLATIVAKTARGVGAYQRAQIDTLGNSDWAKAILERVPQAEERSTAALSEVGKRALQ